MKTTWSRLFRVTAFLFLVHRLSGITFFSLFLILYNSTIGSISYCHCPLSGVGMEHIASYVAPTPLQ
jgi:succinate dehydrogenase/fumarate reductase cytochrome b subunit